MAEIKLQFKSGNVVYSQKYQCKMTVKYYKDGQVICTWFDQQDNIHEEPFNEDELQFLFN